MQMNLPGLCAVPFIPHADYTCYNHCLVSGKSVARIDYDDKLPRPLGIRLASRECSLRRRCASFPEQATSGAGGSARREGNLKTNLHIKEVITGIVNHVGCILVFFRLDCAPTLVRAKPGRIVRWCLLRLLKQMAIEYVVVV